MSAADLTYVPALVYAGPTPYKHVAKGKRDLYVPYHIASRCEREGRAYPPEHTWRYGVSPDDRHLVFFYNMASKKSVWTLPAVDEDGVSRELTHDETMRSEGRTLPAATSSRSAAQSAPASATPTAGIAHPESPIVSTTKGMAAPAAASAPPSGPANARTSPPASVPSATSESAAPTSSVLARLAAWRAKQQNLQPPQRALDAAGDTTKTEEQARATSTPAEAPVEAVPQKPEVNPRVTTAPAPLSPSGPPVHGEAHPNALRGTEAPKVVTPAEAPVSVDAPKEPDDVATALSPEAEELRRAELALQKERVSALRAEALAAQRLWRARQAQADEEEARAKLVERRRVLEADRLAREEEACKARSAALAREEAKRAEADATQNVNRFLEAAAKLKNEENAHKEAYTNFALALAQQLQAASAAAVPTARDSTTKAQDADNMTSPQSSTVADEPTPAHPKQPRIKATLRYDPKFIYTGDLIHLGTDRAEAPRAQRVVDVPRPPLTATASLLLHTVPDGSGRLTIDVQTEPPSSPSSSPFNRPTSSAATAPSPYYYEGEWRHGLPHGEGKLSLPKCAVSGQWTNGELGTGTTPSTASGAVAPVQIQTRRLRGLATMQGSRATGPAHLELENGALFTGFLDNGRPAPRGTSLLLPNGDLIEWLKPTNDTRHALASLPTQNPVSSTRAQTRRAAKREEMDEEVNATCGNGACRLRRANGDLYVGEIKHFLPHGVGHCVFQKHGHEYRGQFWNGWMEGRGTYSFANGDVYIGELHRGVFHGQGALLQKGVFLYEGDWQNGDMHGKGTLTFADTGDVWEGHFQHNQRTEGAYKHCQWRPPSSSATAVSPNVRRGL